MAERIEDGRVRVREDDLTHPAVLDLLRLHAEGMRACSPAGSCHFFDAERLREPDVTFWTAWNGDQLLACGALKRLDARSGEVKSMRTAPDALRRGAGAAILARITEEARARGYRELLLETGASPAFAPSHRLYERFGFIDRGAFADYPADDPFKRFMSRAL